MRATRRTRPWPRADERDGGRAARRAAAARSASRRRARAAAARVSCALQVSAVACQPRGLALARGDDALADGGRARRRLVAQRARRRAAPTASEHVDPVQQRPDEAPLVAREVGGACSGSASPIPHGHGFEAATSMKPRREHHHPLAADDRHVPVLERLAQRLQRRRANSDSSSRNSTPWWASVASPGAGTEPPPTRPDGGDRVVRRAERARGDEPAAVVQAGDRVDARDLDRLVGRQRRQDRRQPAREHRLAGAGRAVQVAGCGRRRRRPRAPGSSALWPRTSARSSCGGAPSPSSSGAGRGAAARRAPRSTSTASCSVLDAEHRRARATSAASRARARGTSSRASPWRRAPSAIASAPRIAPHLAGQRELADDRAAARARPARAARPPRAARPRAAGRSPGRSCAGTRARG